MLGRQDGLFFSRWLMNPLRTGAVIPSGSALAQLMAAEVDLERPGLVVELGGGTGAITKALLQAGIAPGRLIVVEKDPELHGLLTRRFPEVTVLQADATRLRSSLRRHDFASVNTVISSLPLLSMSERRQRLILRNVFACLGEDGVMVQYTYGPGAPVAPARLARWGLVGRPVARCWRNVPPATVWRLGRRRASGADVEAA